MKSKGFTLIELAVVLAIIAVLAAVLTPMVTGYIDQARVARAMGDVRSIADAARLYQRDVGEFPIFSTSAEAPSNAFGGIGGTNGAAIALAAAYFGSVSTSSLEAHINANVLGRDPGAALGRTTFKGPYIGNLDADPWGNKYYITGTNLENGATDWGFVISAGPNGTLDVDPTQAKSGPFVNSTDDIVAVIR